MRVLLLLRGSAGVGKSTYIKEHGLEPYALSADNIRMMCQSPVMQTNGTLAISQSNERLVWSLLFQMLEARMQRGEFVVIDATNSKTQEINRYKDMAKTYRYRMYCVDMTGVPMEECKRRNKLFSRRGNNNLNLRSFLYKGTDDIGGFIGSDAPCYPQYDMFTFQTIFHNLIIYTSGRNRNSISMKL